ncbi:VOC family protein [Sulfitobacter sp. M57]|uniref:VOC family protein n=1 Tax=unclassified Sulfitobacter TaxID=196795 RepID=UPI0023E268FC|nr:MULTISPECIES: VOC family protein [unclassified Sulfitobacter]MDF3414545.1 VOC family protein [Sulfitobacter sp. KE5]MDF3422026.1 VOC family protein [Sulfitobacter sp. KE43]MDF3433091.1 VOC family protein [Sulfitobacter sp. KE42]MDF3458731.1 VOC family protein [Sulfitobacter sp. S74]MDF3462631.1 VOC family protein [Sulfitobacter sp. Ks18]
MKKIQSLGLHHITLMGADRQSSIDFWEGVLGMPFLFDQPNLDDPQEGHLYFDPGDGRLITIFTNENRKRMHTRTPTDAGCVHHIAFEVDRAMFDQVLDRLGARGIGNSGVKDRGFMHSIYFKDPLGLLIELACYTFIPPRGSSHAEVMLQAHKLRVQRGAVAIEREHLADAAVMIVERAQGSLSADRAAKNPFDT